MKKKDQLYFLIKSLTKNERRYFKRFSLINGNGVKTYLALFDFIVQTTEASDDEVRKHFKGESFVAQLHVMKNYLRSLIMKSLRSYHESRTKNSELKELLREAELLFQMELYDQSLESIHKTIKVATDYDRFETLIEAYRLKRQWIQATKGVLNGKTAIQETLALEREAAKKLSIINELQSLSYTTMDIEMGSQSNSIVEHPSMTPENADSSIQAFIHYHHNLYAHHAFRGELTEGLNALDNIVDKLEANPHRIREDISSYVTVLNNKVGSWLHTRNFEKIPDLLLKIRSAPSKFKIPSNRRGIKIFLSTYNVELELYRDTGQWKQGIKLINEIKEFLQENSTDISAEHRITFYYQFAYIYFKAGEYANALPYLNEITASSFGDVRLDMSTYARFLILIIHFELGNILFLRYAVDSCRRFLLKRRKPLHFEKVLLGFFSKLSTEPQGNWQDLFQGLAQNLFRKSTPEEKENILDYLNFEQWINSNLSKPSNKFEFA